MAIPDYQTIMLPLLRHVGDKNEHGKQEIVENLAKDFKLTDTEKKELLQSGQQSIFDNRVGWANTHLKKAGLVEATRRAYIRITERGLEVLKSNPNIVDRKYLSKYPEFIEFIKKEKNDAQESKEIQNDIEDKLTPRERLENAYQKIKNSLAQDLLESVKNCSPKFLEKLVVELLVKMGYGGTFKDAGMAIGQTGDGGIDGIIKEDKLGLDVIYVQAKRWEGTVGRPEIQKFVGALEGQRARKGIFITTSNFSNDAIAYVQKIDKKIVLIDGIILAQYMIDNNIGVAQVSSFDIKKIDSDYFEED